MLSNCFQCYAVHTQEFSFKVERNPAETYYVSEIELMKGKNIFCVIVILFKLLNNGGSSNGFVDIHQFPNISQQPPTDLPIIYAKLNKANPGCLESEMK